MDRDELVTLIQSYLRKAGVRSLCRTYSVDPSATLGGLYDKLLPAGSGKHIDHPSAWVRAIGYRVLQTHLRSDYRRLAVPLPEKFDRVANSNHWEAVSEQWESLKALLAGLPADQREALFAKYGIRSKRGAGAKSCRDLARQLGVSPETVAKRARTAEAFLRHAMGARHD